MMPDQTKPFQIECDMSKYASGVVLTQVDGNATDIRVLLSQKHFQKMKGIMRYMIENYWPLYKHLKNGDTIFKDRLILP